MTAVVWQEITGAWTRQESGVGNGKQSDLGYILQAGLAGLVNGYEVEGEGMRELQHDSEVFQLSNQVKVVADTDT